MIIGAVCTSSERTPRSQRTLRWMLCLRRAPEANYSVACILRGPPAQDRTLARVEGLSSRLGRPKQAVPSDGTFSVRKARLQGKKKKEGTRLEGLLS